MIQAMSSDYKDGAGQGPVACVDPAEACAAQCRHPGRGNCAVQLGFMLGGSIVIEQVFALHGVGFLAWESIGKNDFPWSRRSSWCWR